ncbi:MAG: HD-GYP domain-containing protein [Coriobacteriia bacterium]|nr:HD-GYP domain-containing protein [Coriobacteriia bacterium]
MSDEPTGEEQVPEMTALEMAEELLRAEAAEVAEAETAGEPTVVVFSSRQVRRMRDLLARFSGARRSVRFYPSGHPAVRDGVDGLLDVIRAFHDEGVDVPLTFFENEVLLGEQLLAEESMLFDQLIRDMSASGTNSVTFLRGLDADELERALTILAADDATIDAMGGVEQAVADAHCPHVQIGAVRVMDRGEEVSAGKEGTDKELARESYVGALDLMRELDRLIKANKVASAERVRGVVRSLVDNILSNRYAMLELTGLKDYDEYTFFHSVNVAILSLALGSAVSADRRFLNSLGVGALMHDIGKMTVDLKVLNKPGSLSAAEWELVRKHPVYGAELAAVLPGLDRASIVVILEHHMRYDLDGYPERRPRRRQHLTSRIVAVADAYDAMTSRRSYSAARLQDESVEVLSKNAGTAFDPVLVRLFVQMMGVYPVRSVVRLTGGEVAIVIQPTDDILAPVVRIIADAVGGLVEPSDVDLSDSDAAAGRRVEACLDAAGMNIDVDEFLLN